MQSWQPDSRPRVPDADGVAPRAPKDLSSTPDLCSLLRRTSVSSASSVVKDDRAGGGLGKTESAGSAGPDRCRRRDWSRKGIELEAGGSRLEAGERRPGYGSLAGCRSSQQGDVSRRRPDPDRSGRCFSRNTGECGDVVPRAPVLRMGSSQPSACGRPCESAWPCEGRHAPE
jgi:hypothetical protein